MSGGQGFFSTGTGITIAILDGVALILAGKFANGQTFIVVGALVLGSALVPILFVPVGFIALLFLVLSHPQIFSGGATGMFTKLTAALKGS